MDWRLLAPLLVTSVVTIVGWLAAHQLAAWRDRASKRREQRVEYLVEDFVALQRLYITLVFTKWRKKFNLLSLTFILFGSRDQIVRVESFVKDLSANREASLDDLLDALRNDLRKELRLPSVGGPIWWLRIEPKSNDKH